MSNVTPQAAAGLDGVHIAAKCTEMGIPTLLDALDAGTVTAIAGSVSVEFYCRVAELLADHPDDAAEMADHFGQLLMATLLADGVRLTVGCRTYMRGPDGPMLVTDDRIRHWQWLYASLMDRDAGCRLLELCRHEDPVNGDSRTRLAEDSQ